MLSLRRYIQPPSAKPRPPAHKSGCTIDGPTGTDQTDVAYAQLSSALGLNPIRLIGSTLKTLPQYTVRAPFCYLLCALIPAAIYYMLKFWIVGHALLLAAYYVWLILAHQLGRFFYKNDETLNWDV